MNINWYMWRLFLLIIFHLSFPGQCLIEISMRHLKRHFKTISRESHWDLDDISLICQWDVSLILSEKYLISRGSDYRFGSGQGCVTWTWWNSISSTLSKSSFSTLISCWSITGLLMATRLTCGNSNKKKLNRNCHNINRILKNENH
jgi:hypothetical protein